MTPSTHLARLSFVYFILIFLFFSGIAKADTPSFKRLIAFGDSLVDTGNDPAITFIRHLADGSDVPGLVIPPPTRYDRGRFSNGPVIVDYLAAKLSGFVKPSESGFNLTKDNISYAYGGSESSLENYTPGLFLVPGLKGQVLKFENDLNLNELNFDKTLFVVLTGANDYLNSLSQGHSPNPFQIVDNIVNSVNKLTELGAKHIVVINLPDLGTTPICQFFGACDLLSNLTEAHNDLLANALLDNNKVILFDAYSVVNKILANPDRFGFSENIGPGPATGCLFQSPPQFNIGNCSSVNFNTDSIYWDEIHPSTKVHKILARAIWRKLRD